MYKFNNNKERENQNHQNKISSLLNRFCGSGVLLSNSDN